jgi:bisphosphoglycerate-dependent phosphoglycerate mutase
MNYEQKYLKYKNKYINLKLKITQKGGDDPIKQTNTVQENTVQDKPVQSTEQNYLIVSHNTRIRCFINTLLDANNQQLNIVKNVLDNINKNNKKKETEIRFQNGAVLKLTLIANSEIGTLKLFYSGEVADEDRLYFSNVNNIKKRIQFPPTEFNYVNSFKMNKLENNINFYLVRHGEGVHNTISKLDKAANFITRLGKDPKLTNIGIKQAENTGNQLKEINFSKIFVSKLERTWETAYWILKDNFSNPNPNPNVKINYIVLPCSHELTNYSDTKNCDEANSGVPVGTENISNCESIFSSRIEKCDEFKYNNETIKINWFYYNEFYSQKKELYSDFGRGDLPIDIYKKSNNKCRDSNMILQALITLD